jgi:hypothetical protein
MFHPVFIELAVVYRLFEKPRQMSQRLSNPEYDPRKLYLGHSFLLSCLPNSITTP